MNAKFWPRLFLLALCCLPAVFSSNLFGGAAGAADRFRFVVPGEDASKSATDFSGLSARAAGADGAVQVAPGATDRNYAALIFTSLDGKPLESAHSILLAAVGSADNQGMVWNDSRTSVGNKWGTGPTIVNGIPAELTLPFRVKSVHALDGSGQPQGAVPVRVEGNTSRFIIGPEHHTLWYEID